MLDVYERLTRSSKHKNHWQINTYFMRVVANILGTKWVKNLFMFMNGTLGPTYKSVEAEPNIHRNQTAEVNTGKVFFFWDWCNLVTWLSRWWNFKYIFEFSTGKLGKRSNLTRAYVSNGLVQPPTILVYDTTSHRIHRNSNEICNLFTYRVIF